MKKYENPAIEIEAFSVEDVVTASNTTGCTDNTQMEWDDL